MAIHENYTVLQPNQWLDQTRLKFGQQIRRVQGKKEREKDVGMKEVQASGSSYTRMVGNAVCANVG